LDATGEALAGILRPGNAGSNTASDHIALLHMALAQLPVDAGLVEVIARADSAGLTHGFIDACVTANVRFSVGHDLTEPVRAPCLAVPTDAWCPAITADGSDYRDDADIAEITGMVDLTRWPAGTRMIVRPEVPHPGAQLTFTDIDGRRFRHRLPRSTATRSWARGETDLQPQRHRLHQPALRRLRDQPRLAHTQLVDASS
jgi:hypothetical protein